MENKLEELLNIIERLIEVVDTSKDKDEFYLRMTQLVAELRREQNGHKLQ